jgi:hypothetical protein
VIESSFLERRAAVGARRRQREDAVVPTEQEHRHAVGFDAARITVTLAFQFKKDPKTSEWKVAPSAWETATG